MAGMDENFDVMGDWAPLNPSPRTLFSSLLNDNFTSKSLSDILADDGSQGGTPRAEHQKISDEDESSGDRLLESNAFSGQKSCSGGGLAERWATIAGFNAPALSTQRVGSGNLSLSSSEVMFPYLTIPPGLSSATLLDSPVFVSNSLAQRSPTTGKLTFQQFDHRSCISVSGPPDNSKGHEFEDIHAASFAYKPHAESSSYFTSATNKVAAPTNHQPLPSSEAFVHLDNPILTEILEATKDQSQQHELHTWQAMIESSVRKDATITVTSDPGLSEPLTNSADRSPTGDDQDDGGEQRGEFSSMVVGPPPEDGYTWRKYGQKQVKGSEFPRSYYKCTHLHCQVKKKVERSHEGHITEIIYKGAHNHSKPSQNRRSGIGSSHPPNEMDNETEQGGDQTDFDHPEEPRSIGTQPGNMTGADWIHDRMETTSSASIGIESISMPAQNGTCVETFNAVDVSSSTSNDDEGNQGTHGSASIGYDEEGDESESKRRKIDACIMELSGATRAIREPKVVVQTTSEVDLLDDGYRWRKYGQKVVKGNPNPRSYYKCTNAGCTVRKHVERASHDLKSVITTYEGKHNHDVPAARNSSYNSGPTSMTPAPTPSYIPRSESSHVRNSISTCEVSTRSMFGLPGRQPMRPTSSFSFNMGQAGLTNLAMTNLAMEGLGSATQGKMPGLSVQHSYLGQQQQRKVNEAVFMMPKDEAKEDALQQSSFPVSNGYSVYHQLMSKLPLGPQL